MRRLTNPFVPSLSGEPVVVGLSGDGRKSSIFRRGIWAAVIAGMLFSSSFGMAQEIIPGPRKQGVTPAAATVTERNDAVLYDRWQIVLLGNTRIGSSRDHARRVRENGTTFFRSVNESQQSMKRFGQTVRMVSRLSVDEAETGEMLAFSLEIKNPPAAPSLTAGRVEGKFLKLRMRTGGELREVELPWDPETKGPAWQDRLLANGIPKSSRPIRFRCYLPMYHKSTDVRITSEGMHEVKLFDGKFHKLHRVKIEQSILPTAPVLVYLDERNEILRSETEIVAQQLVQFTVSREESLKLVPAEELDLAVGTLVRVGNLRNGHRARQVKYRITTPGEDPVDHLLATPVQKVRRINAESVEVIVAAPKNPPRRRHVAIGDEFLSANRFLQCDDARVRDHAERATAGQSDPQRVALQMESYVFKKLRQKNFSTALASAAEVARSLEGDCTEHAVLLAAMLRARKIPSRVVVGLVYVPLRSSFGGHMWTEAWIGGEWYPLDATLGQGSIGAAHIALATSNFSDDGPAPVSSFLPLLRLLGKMKIEILEVE